MIKKRSYETRGILELPWITSRRTFSNNQYWDPRYMNFGDLEVINDDVLQPNHMVPNHQHKNMEIIGYIVNGPATHTDSLNNDCLVESDEIQFMSSGSGIWHTERNQTANEIRYIQLWIKPNLFDTEPHWEKRCFPRKDRIDNWTHIAGSQGIKLKQNVEIYSGIFCNEKLFKLDYCKKYYFYIVNGFGEFDSNGYKEGDGFSLIEESVISLKPKESSEIIMFELQ